MSAPAGDGTPADPWVLATPSGQSEGGEDRAGGRGHFLDRSIGAGALAP